MGIYNRSLKLHCKEAWSLLKELPILVVGSVRNIVLTAYVVMVSNGSKSVG